MENRKDYEKRLGERLEAAYMQEDIGPVMSREEFHMLIQTAEKKKRHRRTMLSLAAACVALCLVCGGFVAGMTMRESASAGKDDETKTVQQGGGVVIGSGVSENDKNVGVSTRTYTNIEDIPEDIRKEIHFLDSDEFELEKVKVVLGERSKKIISFYLNEQDLRIEIGETNVAGTNGILVANDVENEILYQGTKIYESTDDKGKIYFFVFDNNIFNVRANGDGMKIEAIIDGLIH